MQSHWLCKGMMHWRTSLKRTAYDWMETKPGNEHIILHEWADEREGRGWQRTEMVKEELYCSLLYCTLAVQSSHLFFNETTSEVCVNAAAVLFHFRHVKKIALFFLQSPKFGLLCRPTALMNCECQGQRVSGWTTGVIELVIEWWELHLCKQEATLNELVNESELFFFWLT